MRIIHLFILILGKSCLSLPNKCSEMRKMTGTSAARYGKEITTSYVDEHAYYAGLIITMLDYNESIHYSVCGASLITANRLLTAAHCWKDNRYEGSSLEVVLGARILGGMGGVSVTTNKIILHPLYNPYDYLLHNIAMIYLPQPILYTSKVNPIGLPSYILTRQKFKNTSGIVVGYADNPDSPRVDLLSVRYEATVTLIGQDDCRKAYGDIIGTSHLCTTSATEQPQELDPCDCPGDSGGPLVLTIDNRQTMAGVAIMSNRIGCPKSQPTVYTRILYYLDFIYDNVD